MGGPAAAPQGGAMTFTESDRSLLDRPVHGLLTTQPGPNRLPAPRPVWFERTPDDEIQLFSMAGALKVRRLQADPRATFVVMTLPDDDPEGWVSMEAEATVLDHGASELALRLSERYWDTSRPEYREVLDLYTVEENLRRIVLHPTRITRGPA
jgi:hypothetical protein